MSALVKVGVIGAGLIADFAHLPGYRANGAEIVAVADVVESRAKAAQKKFEVKKAFKDYHDLLALPEIQAVSVAVPNHLHAPIVLDALAAGKDVLVEKPMALNLAEALAMEDAAAKAGRVLMIGFNSRFRQDVVKLRRLIQAGDLGEVYFASTGYLRRRGYPSGWFTVKAESGGGPVVDIGIHVMDFTRYLVGSPLPVSVVAKTARKFGACPVEDGVWQSSDVREGLRDGSTFDVEDFATAWIRFDNGFIMTLETAWTANLARDRIYSNLLGTKAGAAIDSYHPIHKKGQEAASVEAVDVYTEVQGMVADLALPYHANDSHSAEISHFLAVVEGREAPLITPRDGVVMQAILDGIYRSAEASGEVPIQLQATAAVSLKK